jgi:hypothetical protein
VLAALGMLAAACADAKAPADIVLVPPTDLPELAQQTGEAMLLHATADGRTFLFVEQNQGAQLAIFEVTDPVHIRSDGTVHLGATGTYDFVAPLGRNKELVRLRDGKSEAVLDLRKPKKPTLEIIQGLSLQGSIVNFGEAGFAVADRAISNAPIREYQVVDLSHFPDLNRVFDVKQVRDELTNQDTGTTFLLTDTGLYLIRRPLVESDLRRRERDRQIDYAGS